MLSLNQKNLDPPLISRADRRVIAYAASRVTAQHHVLKACRF